MDWTVLFPDFKSEELLKASGLLQFQCKSHFLSWNLLSSFELECLILRTLGCLLSDHFSPQSLSSCLDGISVRLNTPIFICVSVWTLVYIFLQRCELDWAWLYDMKLNGWWRWSCRNTSAVFSVVDYSRSSLKVFFNDCRMKRLQYNWSSLWLY